MFTNSLKIKQISLGEVELVVPLFMDYLRFLTPLGFVQLYPSFTSVGLGKIWVLNDLYVSKTSRKQGVGRKLMEKSIEMAKESGAVRVDLSTGKNNFVAQGLYKKMEFELDEEYHTYRISLSK